MTYVCYYNSLSVLAQRHLQQDKSDAQGVSSQQNAPVYRLGQHSVSVVLAQISL